MQRRPQHPARRAPARSRSRGSRPDPDPPQHHSVATWTVVSHGQPVSWASRTRWAHQPRPLRGDDPTQTPAPFRGLTLTDRHPADPLQPLTAEEKRILCPLCLVPDLHRPTHRRGPLHQARTEAARTANDVTTALSTLRRLRPELLVETRPPPPPPPAPSSAMDDAVLDLSDDLMTL
ncbi:uncharacterized protein LOC135378746 [Ornithodoros turicata]|uniref:uncharacterized protein LOC135378746 n=1 Tax=Ornithodoros turicata TaxID=34597 RepID=UPI003139A921